MSAAGTDPDRSWLLQPVLIDLDFDDVVGAAAVVRPNVLLPEPHPVERLRRQPVAHLCQLFRIGERPAEALDRAGLAADIERRAHVAERIGVQNADCVAGTKPLLQRTWSSPGHDLPPPASSSPARRW